MADTETESFSFERLESKNFLGVPLSVVASWLVSGSIGDSSKFCGLFPSMIRVELAFSKGVIHLYISSISGSPRVSISIS